METTLRALGKDIGRGGMVHGRRSQKINSPCTPNSYILSPATQAKACPSMSYPKFSNRNGVLLVFHHVGLPTLESIPLQCPIFAPNSPRRSITQFHHHPTVQRSGECNNHRKHSNQYAPYRTRAQRSWPAVASNPQAQPVPWWWAGGVQ